MKNLKIKLLKHGLLKHGLLRPGLLRPKSGLAMTGLAMVVCATTPSKSDIYLFFRQLVELIKAGIPIITCFDILIENDVKSPNASMIRTIKQDLQSGNSLHAALQNHKPQINDLTCHLVRLGEETGQLDRILKIISHHLEKSLQLQSQIRNLLFYPCVILSMASLILLAMFVFVIPRFAELFQNQFESLPAITLFIFHSSLFFKSHLLFVLLLAGCLGAFIYHFRFAFRIQVPRLLRNRIKSIRIIRFIRELGLCYAAGLPLTQALSLCSLPSDNNVFSKHLVYITHCLHKGSSLYEAIQSTHYFPPLLQQLIRIGEASASLDEMLSKAADLLEAEEYRQMERLAKLAEPLIMLVLGVVIGGLVIGMYLPIFNLGNVI